MAPVKPRSPYTRLVLFLFVYLWALTFSRSILPVHYLNEGLTYVQMLVGTVIAMFAPVVFILTLRRTSARNAWRIGIIFTYLSVVLVLDIRSLAQYYIASFLGGFHLYFFFLFYNISHFKSTPQ